MKTPAALQPLIDDGVIDEVIEAFRGAHGIRKAARCAAAATRVP
jgi:hypothetical protein